jgi:phospholipid-translocating ATPase
MLMVGYATYYTMLPVFCIVIDEDVTEETALTYPELYAELRKGRSLNMRTFWTWVFKAVYQGASIMVLCCIFFSMSLLKIVSISFSALVLTELSMLMVEVHTINRFVISSVLTSLLIYAVSVAALPTYFDQQFMMTLGFWWRVIIITAASVVPVSIAKVVHRHINPPTYAKLQSAV